MARLILLYATCILLFCQCTHHAPNEGTGRFSDAGLDSLSAQITSTTQFAVIDVHPARYKRVKAVLMQLFNAASSASYRSLHPAPELCIVEDTNQDFVANHTDGTIYLQAKTLDVLRKLGADSIHALANILGHELSHFFYAKNCSCNTQSSAFLSDKNANIALEKQADLEGGFWCYLAGFKVKWVMPKTLKTIYKVFGIPENPGNYAPLPERTALSLDVGRNLDTLITLYEIAQPLMVAGRFQEALACLQYIDHFGISSPEVQNALGACYFFAAVNPKGNYDYTRFPWCPIVFHQTFPLHHRTFRAEPELAAEGFLLQALSTFNKILSRDTGNGTALINKLSTLVCLKDTNAIREELRLHHSLLQPSTFTLFKAFSFLLQNRNDLALTALTAVVQTSKDSAEQNLAKYNIEQLKDQTPLDPSLSIFIDDDPCEPIAIPSKVLHWNNHLSIGMDPFSKSWCIRLPRSFTMGRTCSASNATIRLSGQIWLTHKGYWTAQSNSKNALIFLHNAQGAIVKKITLTFENW